MKEILLYFRRHRWQRLTLTLSFAVMLAAGLTVAFREPLADYILIHRLTSSKAAVRDDSAMMLAGRAMESPRTRARLEKRLTVADDAKFLAAARVLDMAGLLDMAGRDPEILDRWRAVRMSTSVSSRARYVITWEACIVDRDNAHVRRLLAIAAADDDTATRSLGGVLAAKLGDDATLAKLLADESAEVRAFAAIDAGIAGRKELLELTAAQDETDPFAADCMLYALALVGSDLAAPAACRNLQPADPQDDQARLSLDRTLLIADMLGDDSVTDAVGELIAAYAADDRRPPALAVLVAARRGMADIAPHVRDTMRAAADPDAGGEVTVAQLTAALEAAKLLKIPLRKEAFTVVDMLWGPAHENVMVAAAEVLGEQADLPQDLPEGPVPSSAEGPTRKGCIRLLQGKASWLLREPVADEPDVLHTTPMASAAAALALWRLGVNEVEHFLHDVAMSEYTLPGDYLAWHISREDPAAGMELGMGMLPALNAPHNVRVYSDNVRAAGAMMLALSARTDEQRAAAAERIRSRLVGGKYGGEDNRQVRWAYMCALAITGDNTYREHLSALLSVTEFSQHRLLTALLTVGDREAMDWLLWHPQFADSSVVELLLDGRIGEVLAAVAPELPHVEWAAAQDVRLWQARILRDTYAIRHADILTRELP